MGFDTSKIQILALCLDFKVQRTCMTFRFLFEALEDFRGIWLGFGILMCIGATIFDTLNIQIFALCLDFEGTKNTHVL